MLNVKTCPNLNCIMNILIDKIFIYSSQQNDENNKLKKELFEIYFDYFSSKIYEIGNPPEESNPNYQNKIVSLSFIINILKQLFKFILHYSNDDISKSKITTLLINCVLLTKTANFSEITSTSFDAYSNIFHTFTIHQTVNTNFIEKLYI